MDDLQLFLQQAEKYLSDGENVTTLPYQTNFFFLDKYPYETVKVAVPEWVRVDGLGQQVTGTIWGWKLLCLFNGVLSPTDLIGQNVVYLPANFQLAVDWLRRLNKKQRKE